MVIDTVTEGRKLPSWRVMTPLMRVAALALQGKTRPWEDAPTGCGIPPLRYNPHCQTCRDHSREA